MFLLKNKFSNEELAETAHFLVDAALCVFLLKNEFSNKELAETAQFISRRRQKKIGSNLTNRITQQFDERIQSKLTYHTLVLKIKNFILAETIHNHFLHLATVVDMLPTFATAGHTQYTKGARLYVQMMQRNITTYTSAKNIFQVHKLHTVR